MSAVSRWYQRFARLIREFARFAVVGGIGLLVTDGAFNLMISERRAVLTANAVATLAAAVVTFLGSRYWTFRHRRRAGLGREMVTFSAANLVGILIQQACLELAARELGAGPDKVTLNAAFLAGMGLATGFRFWSYRRYVWPTSSRTGVFPADPCRSQRAGAADSPDNIEKTRRYLQDFDAAAERADNAQDLYEEMIERYPDRINRGVVWGSAQAIKG